MRISVVNESTLSADLTFPLLGQICDALTRQTFEHMAPFCESQGVVVYPVAKLADVPAGDCPMVILDSADQAGVLGYHSTTPDGRPYARVFLGPILVNAGTLTKGSTSLSVTMSHEALEAAGDPYATWWSDGPDGKEFALELGDPVEGDSYEIDGIAVSNFVGPRYFSSGPGPYDWMRLLTAPFTMTSGGYQIVRTSGADVSQNFAAEFPEWKRAGKAHVASRTSRRANR